MDDDILAIIVDLNRLVDRDNLEQGAGRRGAHVTSEYLSWFSFFSKRIPPLWKIATHWVIQAFLLLQISEAAINNRAHGTACLGPSAHQPSVESIRRAGIGCHEDDSAGRNRINLFCVLALFQFLLKQDGTDVVARPLGPLIIERGILNSIHRSDYLGEPILALGRPHGDTGKKAAIVNLELDKGVRDIASVWMEVNHELSSMMHPQWRLLSSRT